MKRYVKIVNLFYSDGKLRDAPIRAIQKRSDSKGIC